MRSTQALRKSSSSSAGWWKTASAHGSAGRTRDPSLQRSAEVRNPDPGDRRIRPLRIPRRGLVPSPRRGSRGCSGDLRPQSRPPDRRLPPSRPAAAAGKFTFIGVKKCATCHQATNTGAQLKQMAGDGSCQGLCHACQRQGEGHRGRKENGEAPAGVAGVPRSAMSRHFRS